MQIDFRSTLILIKKIRKLFNQNQRLITIKGVQAKHTKITFNVMLTK